MLYISIRQDEESNATVEYILCDGCRNVPEETEIEAVPAPSGCECEICGEEN